MAHGCPGRAWPGQVCSNPAPEVSDLAHPPPHFSHFWGWFISWRGWGRALSGRSSAITSLQDLAFHSILTVTPAVSPALTCDSPVWICFPRASRKSVPLSPNRLTLVTRLVDQQTPSIWGSLVFASANCALENRPPFPAQPHWTAYEGFTGKDSPTSPSSPEVGIWKPQRTKVCLVRGTQISLERQVVSLHHDCQWEFPISLECSSLPNLSFFPRWNPAGLSRVRS